MPDRLTQRALNRLTLARQLLLDRSGLTPAEAIAHLAGLQAQAPLAPYVGLQARLAAFRPDQLENILNERIGLRAHLMRNTVHLVTARDYLRFRPLFQPPMDRALAGAWGRRLGPQPGAETGVDLAALREAAAALLAETPLTRADLGRALAPRWPHHDPAALAYAATHLLPLVHVPPRGLWTQTGPAAFTLAPAWLDIPAPPDPRPTVEELVLRYLAAYGPATVADIQAWSGLTRLREVTERLGRKLRRRAGPDGAALLDLADAPPDADPDVPAPPRFLPEYDNLLLSYAERSRVIPHRRPVPLPPGNGASCGTLLVDGFWQAEWRITKKPVLEVRSYLPLGAADTEAITAEGERLLAFARPDAAAPEVRFVRDGE